jgi:hypothetical protein
MAKELCVDEKTLRNRLAAAGLHAGTVRAARVREREHLAASLVRSGMSCTAAGAELGVSGDVVRHRLWRAGRRPSVLHPERPPLRAPAPTVNDVVAAACDELDVEVAALGGARASWQMVAYLVEDVVGRDAPGLAEALGCARARDVAELVAGVRARRAGNAAFRGHVDTLRERVMCRVGVVRGAPSEG